MTSAAQALSDWLEQFELPVYLSNDVPDDAEAPYMTIPMNEPEWNAQATFYIQIWYRTRTNVELMSKADEIVSAIGTGVVIDCDGGHVVLWPESPLIQLIVDGDYRSAYINLSINSYTMPGV